MVGLLLAAGAGTRFGGPKALARSPVGVPWLVDRVTALELGGCSPVLVVLGARAAEARRLLPASAVPVVAKDWERGLSSSLRAGLDAAARLDSAPTAALVALVDTPGLTASAVRRLTRLADGEAGDAVLARASYRGRPGHPVLLGQRHWRALADAVTGDRGAAAYLEEAGASLVECADVADGDDVDERPAAGTTPDGAATAPPG